MVYSQTACPGGREIAPSGAHKTDKHKPPPQDRAKALQDGFMAMTKDPAFIDEANKMSLELSPIDGEAVRRIIAQMSETPREVIDQLNEIVSLKR